MFIYQFLFPSFPLDFLVCLLVCLFVCLFVSSSNYLYIHYFIPEFHSSSQAPLYIQSLSNLLFIFVYIHFSSLHLCTYTLLFSSSLYIYTSLLFIPISWFRRYLKRLRTYHRLRAIAVLTMQKHIRGFVGKIRFTQYR